MTDDFTASLPRKRMGAGALLTDEQGRVLLVEPTYKDYWEIPGGSVEADESPHAAVVRELKEELSLSVPLGRLLVVDWVPPRPDRTEGLMVDFVRVRGTQVFPTFGPAPTLGCARQWGPPRVPPARGPGSAGWVRSSRTPRAGRRWVGPEDHYKWAPRSRM